MVNDCRILTYRWNTMIKMIIVMKFIFLQKDKKNHILALNFALLKNEAQGLVI